MRDLLAGMRGQVILVIIFALLLAQAVSLWLFVDERSLAVRAALGFEAADRAANVALLIHEAPIDLHPSILRAASSPLVRFEINKLPAVGHEGHGRKGIENRIRTLLGNDFTAPVRVELHEIEPELVSVPGIPQDMLEMHKEMLHDQLSTMEMRLSIALQSGQWLNVETRFHQPPLQWAWVSTLSFGITSAFILVLALWFVLTRLIGPLRNLSDAAERLGRGEEVAELHPTGPSEVRDLTKAFNRMQARLTRFVSDRTRLLAALGHDLRSPLTAIRVRAEMIEDDETRERIVTSVEEMQEMVDATLSFARGMAMTEPSKTVDLGRFVNSLCHELRETGSNLKLEVSEGLVARVRANSLRRALRNVIENAVRYGSIAHISLLEQNGAVRIFIADEGPGIATDALEKVFDPFVRLETSRSRETGGTGLGLSIAKTIIQAHGGSISLENRPEGGLLAIIELPLEDKTHSEQERKTDEEHTSHISTDDSNIGIYSIDG